MINFKALREQTKAKGSLHGYVLNKDVKAHDDWLESEGLGGSHGKRDKTHTKMHYPDSTSYSYGSDFHDPKRK